MTNHHPDDPSPGELADSMVQLLATDLVQLEADLFYMREENAALRSQLESLLEEREMATEHKPGEHDDPKHKPGEGKPPERDQPGHKSEPPGTQKPGSTPPSSPGSGGGHGGQSGRGR